MIDVNKNSHASIGEENILKNWKEYLGIENYSSKFKVPLYVDGKNERAKPLGIKIDEFSSSYDFEKLIQDFTKFGYDNGLTRIGEIIVPKNYELEEIHLENGWTLKKEVAGPDFIDYALIKKTREEKRATPEEWKEKIKNAFLEALDGGSKNLPKVYLESAKEDKFKNQIDFVIENVNKDFENYGLEKPESNFEELYLITIEKDNEYIPIGAIELIKMPNGIWEYSIGIIKGYCGKGYGESALVELIKTLKNEKEKGNINIDYLYGDIMNIPSGKALARACKKLGIGRDEIYFGFHELQGNMFSISMGYEKMIENGYIDTFAVYVKI